MWRNVLTTVSFEAKAVDDYGEVRERAGDEGSREKTKPMCTLHVFFHMFAETPLLLLANRDELIGRDWSPPGRLSAVPKIFGPRDNVAGGTWLGVNEAGVVAALTNHEGSLSTGGSLCSRGFLVVETLRHATAREAKRLAEAMAPACKEYSLLIADAHEAFVVDHSGDDAQTYSLMPGPHVVTNDRFRNPEDSKAKRSLERMQRLATDGRPDPGVFAKFLSDHHKDDGQRTSLCVHDELDGRFGTTSSSAVAVGNDGNVEGFWFAPGAPCLEIFSDVTPDFNVQWDQNS